MKKIFQIIGIVFISCFYLQCSLENDAAAPSSDTGIGGSLAAMTIVSDFLYLIDNQSITVFNLTNPATPVQVGDPINVGFGIETLFARGDRLFIGSQTGMFIYDITNPVSPEPLANHTHFYGCDPVVANDSIAFVTVRSAENCRGLVEVNQLEVVDVTNPANPNSLQFVNLNNPAGLGLDGDYLFVTDGDAGIKVFDVSAPRDGIELIGHIPVNVFDVITLDGLLIAVGSENLYQFDYTDIGEITQLSALQLRP